MKLPEFPTFSEWLYYFYALQYEEYEELSQQEKDYYYNMYDYKYGIYEESEEDYG